jgi:hypothetical protein
MKLARLFRGDPERELDALVASINAGWLREHREDGTHRQTLANVQSTIIAGAAAGHHVVDGIEVGDRLMTVLQFVGAGVAVTDVVDLTSEFSVTAPNRITNTSGTDTTGDALEVRWLDLT